MFRSSRPSSSSHQRPPAPPTAAGPGSALSAAAVSRPGATARSRRDREARSERSSRAAGSVALFATDGELLSLTNERQELLCSVIGLLVKLGLVTVAAVSLIRLAGAYQQRMERQGEIGAVLELEMAQMAKARQRFDQLFNVDGEQRLIREQSQWIAPNRLRVVWQQPKPQPRELPTVETARALPTGTGVRP